MAEAAEANLGSRVCKLQEQEVGEPRAGCQGWYGSPDDCSGFQKWQKQSGLKLIWMLRNIQEFVPWNPSSRTLRRWRLPGLSVICHRGACSSSQRPGRQETETETENGIGADVSPPPRHAARHSAGPRRWFTGQAWKQQLAAPHESGSKSCLHSIRYFLPFRSLERAESCYARIKNKCSRNGPAGNAQQEAFTARPRAPAAKSNRYAQYFSTSSQITITHIQASTCSSENKEAPLSASTSIEAARLSVMKFSISPWVFQPCTAPWTSSRLPRCKVRRALQPPSLQITKDKLGDPAGPSQHRRQSVIFVLGWCSVWWLRAEKSTMVNYSWHIPAHLQ